MTDKKPTFNEQYAKAVADLCYDILSVRALLSGECLPITEYVYCRLDLDADDYIGKIIFSDSAFSGSFEVYIDEFDIATIAKNIKDAVLAAANANPNDEDLKKPVWHFITPITCDEGDDPFKIKDSYICRVAGKYGINIPKILVRVSPDIATPKLKPSLVFSETYGCPRIPKKIMKRY